MLLYLRIKNTSQLMAMNQRPLVVHLIYRLDFGGLETLLAECINGMPAEKYRHAIVCLTDYTEFSKKITRPDVAIYSLNKKPGLGLGTHFIIWKLFKHLRPTILHTYNLSAIEYTLAATLAGVPVCVHAEHGRDSSDVAGTNWKYNLLRRLLIPFVDCFIPVSNELRRWLKSTIRVPDKKNILINNGVDIHRFKQNSNKNITKYVETFPEDSFVIGTVGRIQDIKNHSGLIDAFIALIEQMPSQRNRLRLVIVGDGPLLSVIRAKVLSAGIADLVWLAGVRDDVADIMQTFSIFVMTSVTEGTPVVILEAMATGLPVVATKVGGIPEVVVDGITGQLVAATDMKAFANTLAVYVSCPDLLVRHGMAGRARIESIYSIDAMLSAYAALYDNLCNAKHLS